MVSHVGIDEVYWKLANSEVGTIFSSRGRVKIKTKHGAWKNINGTGLTMSSSLLAAVVVEEELIWGLS